MNEKQYLINIVEKVEKTNFCKDQLKKIKQLLKKGDYTQCWHRQQKIYNKEIWLPENIEKLANYTAKY